MNRMRKRGWTPISPQPQPQPQKRGRNYNQLIMREQSHLQQQQQLNSNGNCHYNHNTIIDARWLIEVLHPVAINKDDDTDDTAHLVLLAGLVWQAVTQTGTAENPQQQLEEALFVTLGPSVEAMQALSLIVPKAIDIRQNITTMESLREACTSSIIDGYDKTNNSNNTSNNTSIHQATKGKSSAHNNADDNRDQLLSSWRHQQQQFESLSSSSLSMNYCKSARNEILMLKNEIHRLRTSKFHLEEQVLVLQSSGDGGNSNNNNGNSNSNSKGLMDYDLLATIVKEREQLRDETLYLKSKIIELEESSSTTITTKPKITSLGTEKKTIRIKRKAALEVVPEEEEAAVVVAMSSARIPRKGRNLKAIDKPITTKKVSNQRYNKGVTTKKKAHQEQIIMEEDVLTKDDDTNMTVVKENTNGLLSSPLQSSMSNNDGCNIKVDRQIKIGAPENNNHDSNNNDDYNDMTVIVVPITLPNSGPLGIRFARRGITTTATSPSDSLKRNGNKNDKNKKNNQNQTKIVIVEQIVPNSQAENAGLKPGDVLCYPNTNGEKEIEFDSFLRMSRSKQRPIYFEARRCCRRHRRVPERNSTEGGGGGITNHKNWPKLTDNNRCLRNSTTISKKIAVSSTKSMPDHRQQGPTTSRPSLNNSRRNKNSIPDGDGKDFIENAKAGTNNPQTRMHDLPLSPSSSLVASAVPYRSYPVPKSGTIKDAFLPKPSITMNMIAPVELPKKKTVIFPKATTNKMMISIELPTKGVAALRNPISNENKINPVEIPPRKATTVVNNLISAKMSMTKKDDNNRNDKNKIKMNLLSAPTLSSKSPKEKTKANAIDEQLTSTLPSSPSSSLLVNDRHTILDSDSPIDELESKVIGTKVDQESGLSGVVNAGTIISKFRRPKRISISNKNPKVIEPIPSGDMESFLFPIIHKKKHASIIFEIFHNPEVRSNGRTLLQMSSELNSYEVNLLQANREMRMTEQAVQTEVSEYHKIKKMIANTKTKLNRNKQKTSVVRSAISKLSFKLPSLPFELSDFLTINDKETIVEGEENSDDSDTNDDDEEDDGNDSNNEDNEEDEQYDDDDDDDNDDDDDVDDFDSYDDDNNEKQQEHDDFNAALEDHREQLRKSDKPLSIDAMVAISKRKKIVDSKNKEKEKIREENKKQRLIQRVRVDKATRKKLNDNLTRYAKRQKVSKVAMEKHRLNLKFSKMRVDAFKSCVDAVQTKMALVMESIHECKHQQKAGMVPVNDGILQAATDSLIKEANELRTLVDKREEQQRLFEGKNSELDDICFNLSQLKAELKTLKTQKWEFYASSKQVTDLGEACMAYRKAPTKELREIAKTDLGNCKRPRIEWNRNNNSSIKKSEEEVESLLTQSSALEKQKTMIESKLIQIILVADEKKNILNQLWNKLLDTVLSLIQDGSFGIEMLRNGRQGFELLLSAILGSIIDSELDLIISVIFAKLTKNINVDTKDSKERMMSANKFWDELDGILFTLGDSGYSRSDFVPNDDAFNDRYQKINAIIHPIIESELIRIFKCVCEKMNKKDSIGEVKDQLYSTLSSSKLGKRAKSEFIFDISTLTNERGLTLLFASIVAVDRDTVELCLSLGADPNRSLNGISPVMAASLFSSKDITECLMNNGGCGDDEIEIKWNILVNGKDNATKHIEDWNSTQRIAEQATVSRDKIFKRSEDLEASEDNRMAYLTPEIRKKLTLEFFESSLKDPTLNHDSIKRVVLLETSVLKWIQDSKTTIKEKQKFIAMIRSLVPGTDNHKFEISRRSVVGIGNPYEVLGIDLTNSKMVLFSPYVSSEIDGIYTLGILIWNVISPKDVSLHKTLIASTEFLRNKVKTDDRFPESRESVLRLGKDMNLLDLKSTSIYTSRPMDLFKIDIDEEMDFLSQTSFVPKKRVLDKDQKLANAIFGRNNSQAQSEKAILSQTREGMSTQLYGGAGTGKTRLLTQKIISECIEDHILIVSRLHRLISVVKTEVERKRDARNIVFSTYEELCSNLTKTILPPQKNQAENFSSFSKVQYDETLSVSSITFQRSFMGYLSPKELQDLEQNRIESATLWAGIRIIKANIICAKNLKHLSRHEYLDLPPVFGLNKIQRDIVYNLYNVYEIWLKQDGRKWDEADRILYILRFGNKVFSDSRYLSWQDRYFRGVENMVDEDGQPLSPFFYHKVFVDEAQDFSELDLALFLRMSGGIRSVFLAADPAQSVEVGLKMRKNTVNDVYHQSISTKGLQVKDALQSLEMNTNHRTHAGNLALSKTIRKMMTRSFKIPNTNENALIVGPVPEVLLLKRFKDLGNEVNFRGANIVFLCPDEELESWKDQMSNNGIENDILGVREAKGLEFDACALIGFFSYFERRQSGPQWKNMILWLSSETGLTTTEGQFEPCDYLLSHPEVEDEAMLLYTALTRARNRLYLIEFEDDGIRRKKGEKGIADYVYRHLEQLDGGLVKRVTQIDEGKKEITPQQHKARGVRMITKAIAKARSSSTSTTEIRIMFEQAMKMFSPAFGNDRDLYDLAAQQMEATILKIKLRQRIETTFFEKNSGSFNVDKKFQEMLKFEQELVKYMEHTAWNTFMTDDFHEIVSLVEEMISGTPYEGWLGKYLTKLSMSHESWYQEICELSNVNQ